MQPKVKCYYVCASSDEVDIDFSTDEPEIAGKITIPSRDGKKLFRIVSVQPEKPIFRAHGERVVRERLEAYLYTAGQLIAGMDGQPFVWDEVTRRRASYMARRMGATLITNSFAHELGLRPVEGQQPVGAGQFDWGRKRKPYGQLYIMECQLEKIPPQQSEETGNNEY